jgi:hypothetical protein
MDGESGGAYPQIENKFHCNRRNETTDAALTSVLVIASIER